MSKSLRTDGAPMRTPQELTEFLDTLIEATAWPPVSADDLREVREMLATLPAGAAMRMRYEASMLAMGDQEALRRCGHRSSAETRLSIAEGIHALDVEAAVAHASGAPVVMDPDETVAFESAASAEFLSASRYEDGAYQSNRTRTALAIWRAAVRWVRGSTL